MFRWETVPLGCRWGTATIFNQRLDLFEQVAVLEMVPVPELTKPQGVMTRVQAPISDRECAAVPWPWTETGASPPAAFCRESPPKAV